MITNKNDILTYFFGYIISSFFYLDYILTSKFWKMKLSTIFITTIALSLDFVFGYHPCTDFECNKWCIGRNYNRGVCVRDYVQGRCECIKF